MYFDFQMRTKKSFSDPYRPRFNMERIEELEVSAKVSCDIGCSSTRNFDYLAEGNAVQGLSNPSAHDQTVTDMNPKHIDFQVQTILGNCISLLQAKTLIIYFKSQ